MAPAPSPSRPSSPLMLLPSLPFSSSSDPRPSAGAKALRDACARVVGAGLLLRRRLEPARAGNHVDGVVEQRAVRLGGGAEARGQPTHLLAQLFPVPAD